MSLILGGAALPEDSLSERKKRTGKKGTLIYVPGCVSNRIFNQDLTGVRI